MEVNEKQKRILREISALLLSKPTETERLLLRPFRKTDLSELYEYLSQKEQQRLAGNPPVDSLDDAREVLDWILDPSRPSHSLAIVLRAENKVIGNLTLGKCPFLEDDEKLRALRGVALSYVLNERYWRKGYMTELLRAVYPILPCLRKAAWTISSPAISPSTPPPPPCKTSSGCVIGPTASSNATASGSRLWR